MKGISIAKFDERRVLAIELHEVLEALDGRAVASTWTVEGGEATGGEAAAELERLSDAGERVTGDILLTLARAVGQVIDGAFTAYEAGRERPWARVTAVDSSAFDVDAEDEEVLAGLRERFREADVVDV